MIITADFETYYTDKGLGFKTQTTEEYIRDPDFEVIGVSVQVDDGVTPGEPVWFSGTHEEIRKFLLQYDWKNSFMLAHNTLFDGAILHWHFGITPMAYLDTLSMARALHGVEVGGSLAKLAERYQIGAKGDEVVHAINKRRLDFTPEELTRYGEYCKNDTALTYKLLTRMISNFPGEELKLIDMTLRMFTHPQLYVDEGSLEERLIALRQEKSELLSSLMQRLECATEEDVRAKLSSNKQFAQVLLDLNIEPPKKISPVTGKETWALAKKDEAFLALCEHEDPFIQQLCAVRLGTKSTLEEKRIERFMDIGRRNNGAIPVPLKYYGAHTGRWCLTGDHEVLTPSGWVRIDKWDGQPIRQWDAENKEISWAVNPKWLRFHTSTPLVQFNNTYHKGIYTQEHRIPCLARHTTNKVADIQAGKLAALHTRDLFVSGNAVDGRVEDPTKLRLIVAMHADGYNVHDHKNNMVRFRFVKSRKVDRLSKLLDTSAILFKVTSYPSEPDVKVITIKGDDAPDWLRMAKSLPLWFYDLSRQSAEVVLDELKYWDGYVSGPNSVAWGGKDREAASIYASLAHMCGRRAKLRTVTREADWSTVYKLNIVPALTVREKHINAQLVPYSGEVFCFEVPTGYFMCRRGDTIFVTGNSGTDKINFQNLPSRDKKKKALKRAIVPPEGYVVINSDSSQIEARVLAWWAGQEDVVKQFAEKQDVYSIFSSSVYGRTITKADETERFVGKTCVLGLGYGTGAAKLQGTLATSQPVSVKIDLDEAKRIVGVYREKNHKVVDLWGECDSMLDTMMNSTIKTPLPLGQHGCVHYDNEGIILPNGLRIRYPGLRRETKDGKSQIVYDSRKGPVSIWGGTVVENVVQALARIIVGTQMVEINEKLRVALTVHDAAVIVAPHDESDAAKEFVTGIMSKAPGWAQGLPVACEAKVGATYGDV